LATARKGELGIDIDRDRDQQIAERHGSVFGFLAHLFRRCFAISRTSAFGRSKHERPGMATRLLALAARGRQ
jgi:hypothetical protein